MALNLKAVCRIQKIITKSKSRDKELIKTQELVTIVTLQDKIIETIIIFRT